MRDGQIFFLVFGVVLIALLIVWAIIDERKINKQLDRTREAMKTNQSYPPVHRKSPHDYDY